MWTYYVFGGLAVLLIALIIISYQSAKKSSVPLEAEEFKNQMRKGQLVDVRTKNEYDKGHINGARNISLQLLTREYKKLRTDQPIYLYCQSGKRSSRAAVILKSKGFDNLYQLKDGLNSWNGPLK